MTDAEYKLWEDCLKHMPVRFRRQRPFGPYILDFYCPKAKLVIEIDGISHSLNEIAENDIKRSEYIQNNGLKVIRFQNQEVQENLEGVDKVIREQINKTIK